MWNIGELLWIIGDYGVYYTILDAIGVEWGVYGKINRKSDDMIKID